MRLAGQSAECEAQPEILAAALPRDIRPGDEGVKHGFLQRWRDVAPLVGHFHFYVPSAGWLGPQQNVGTATGVIQGIPNQVAENPPENRDINLRELGARPAALVNANGNLQQGSRLFVLPGAVGEQRPDIHSLKFQRQASFLHTANIEERVDLFEKTRGARLRGADGAQKRCVLRRDLPFQH